MPALYGSVTPSAAAVATAASAALPPRASTSRPTWLASRSTEATAPPDPVMTGTLGCWVVGCGGLVVARADWARAVVGARSPTHRLPAASPANRTDRGMWDDLVISGR